MSWVERIWELDLDNTALNGNRYGVCAVIGFEFGESIFNVEFDGFDSIKGGE